jgi:hypothetical protein
MHWSAAVACCLLWLLWPLWPLGMWRAKSATVVRGFEPCVAYHGVGLQGRQRYADRVVHPLGRRAKAAGGRAAATAATAATAAATAAAAAAAAAPRAACLQLIAMRGRGRGGVYAVLLRRQVRVRPACQAACPRADLLPRTQCPLWLEQRSVAEQHERCSEDGAAQRVLEAAGRRYRGVWRAARGGARAAREARFLAVLHLFAARRVGDSDGGDAEAALGVLGHLAPEESVRARRRPLGHVESGLPAPSHTQVELIAKVRLCCRLPVHGDRARGVDEQRGWAQHLGSASESAQADAP